MEISELDPAHFLSAPRLAWQTCLNKTKFELEFMIDIDILLVENGIRGGKCHAYITMQKKIINTWKTMTPTIVIHSSIGKPNKSYGWLMSQKLNAVGFKWRKVSFNFCKNFIQSFYKAYIYPWFWCWLSWGTTEAT